MSSSYSLITVRFFSLLKHMQNITEPQDLPPLPDPVRKKTARKAATPATTTTLEVPNMLAVPTVTDSINVTTAPLAMPRHSDRHESIAGYNRSQQPVDITCPNNASQLERWTTRLLNASAHEVNEIVPVFKDNNFHRDFDQLASSEDVDFISHNGVDFATFKGEHFRNSGYMRIHPYVTKERSRAKKFDLVSAVWLELSDNCTYFKDSFSPVEILLFMLIFILPAFPSHKWWSRRDSSGQRYDNNRTWMSGGCSKRATICRKEPE